MKNETVNSPSRGRDPDFPPVSCPLEGKAVLDMYFLENRARILEIASFLDRIERCEEADAARMDFRYRSFMRALAAVTGLASGRTEAVQLLFSDPAEHPADTAGGPAAGAWNGDSR